MSNYLNTLVQLGCFIVLTGCSKQESNQSSDPLLGMWQVSSFMPASLATDSALTIKEALALFLMDGEMRPATITVNKSELKLRTVGGDSAVMPYTLMNVEDDRYRFQTEEGDAEFVVENSKKATLKIAGATYELSR